MNLSEHHKKELKKLAGINEAVKTECQTPDTTYNINISEKEISVSIDLPKSFNLNKEEAILLEKNIHNALELVLAKYFNIS